VREGRPAIPRASGCASPDRPYSETLGATGSRCFRAAKLTAAMDPNTHAYVVATAFFTSVFFALAAWLPVAMLLRMILVG